MKNIKKTKIDKKVLSSKKTDIGNTNIQGIPQIVENEAKNTKLGQIKVQVKKTKKKSLKEQNSELTKTIEEQTISIIDLCSKLFKKDKTINKLRARIRRYEILIDKLEK